MSTDSAVALHLPAYGEVPEMVPILSFAILIFLDNETRNTTR